MPEIRRHSFLEEYCIIAAERNKRPSDFLVAKAVPGDEKDCPFCLGHEDRTPPTIAAYTDDGIQIIRNALQKALDLGVARKGIAPEELDSDGRKIPSYTITVPRSADVSVNNKANRLLQDVRFTARLAGAIHVVEIRGSLAYAL